MNIDKLVLHAYGELQIIDEEIEDRKYLQAISRSDGLLKLIDNNRSSAEEHPNYALIKLDLERIESEIKISKKIAGVRVSLTDSRRLYRQSPPSNQNKSYD